MENIKKHYNALEKELATLVTYHIRRIELLNRKNIRRRDDAEWLRLLNNTFEVINTDVKERLAFAEQEKKDQESLMAQRTIADCPVCKDNKKVLIAGETTHEKFGWKLDIVKCTECNTRFTNYIPNNTKDIILFQENFITQLYVVREDGRTYAEILEMDKKRNKEEMLEDLEQSKQAYKEAEQRKMQHLIAIQEKAVRLESCRDQLLLAKINDDDWNMKKYLA